MPKEQVEVAERPFAGPNGDKATTDIPSSRVIWQPCMNEEGQIMLLTNHDIARRLREQASALARGGDNLYRVRAFRQAAMAVLALPEEVSSLVAQKGPRELERLPGIGKSLAGTIAGYLNAA
jgi:DNA polymerase (family 10)